VVWLIVMPAGTPAPAGQVPTRRGSVLKSAPNSYPYTLGEAADIVVWGCGMRCHHVWHAHASGLLSGLLYHRIYSPQVSVADASPWNPYIFGEAAVGIKNDVCGCVMRMHQRAVELKLKGQLVDGGWGGSGLLSVLVGLPPPLLPTPGLLEAEGRGGGVGLQAASQTISLLSILLALCHKLHFGSHWLVLEHLINHTAVPLAVVLIQAGTTQ
jgi:hypothetical protein